MVFSTLGSMVGGLVVRRMRCGPLASWTSALTRGARDGVHTAP
jgi:hypothetical protein